MLFQLQLMLFQLQEIWSMTDEQRKAVKIFMQQLIHEGYVHKDDWPQLQKKWFKDWQCLTLFSNRMMLQFPFSPPARFEEAPQYKFAQPVFHHWSTQLIDTHCRPMRALTFFYKEENLTNRLGIHN